MKNFLQVSFLTVLLMATLFSCQNAAGPGGWKKPDEPVPDSPTPTDDTIRSTVFYYGELQGVFAEHLKSADTRANSTEVPTNLVIFSHVPTDAKTKSNIKKAFNNGVPVGLVGATHEHYKSLADFLGMDIINHFSSNSNDSVNAKRDDDILIVSKSKSNGMVSIYITGFDNAIAKTTDTLTEKSTGKDYGGSEMSLQLSDSKYIKPGFSPEDAKKEITDLGYNIEGKAPSAEDPVAKSFISESYKKAIIKDIFAWEKNTNAIHSIPKADKPVLTGSPSYDLADLVSGYRVHQAAPAEIQQDYDGEQVYKFPIISIDYVIRSLHDFNTNQDVYVVEKSTSRDTSSIYWSNDQAAGKLCTYWYEVANWTSKAETEAYIDAPTGTVTMDGGDLMFPKTTEGSVTQSSTFSFSLSANASVGQNGDNFVWGAGVSGTIGYSDTKSITIPDVTIELKSNGGSSTENAKNKYKYSVNAEDYLQDRLDENAPAIARSTFTTSEAWVWRVKDPTEGPLTLHGKETHTSGRRYYACFAAGGRRFGYVTKSFDYSFPMPVPQHFALNTSTGTDELFLNKDGTQQLEVFSVFSHDDGTIEVKEIDKDGTEGSDAAWIRLGQYTFSKIDEANLKPTSIDLKCEENDTDEPRRAIVRIKITKDGEAKTLFELKVFQEVNPKGVSGIVLLQNTAHIKGDGTPTSIKFKSSENWKAESSYSWCLIDQTEGSAGLGDGDNGMDFTISARKNIDDFPREATVTFTTASGKTATLVVKQDVNF